MRFLTVLLLCVVSVYSQECGRSRPKTPPTRIVGGRDAVEREFPWQLSLQVKSRNNRWFHVCGASVLSPTRALTAAHCYMSSAKYRVVAGLHNQNTMDNEDVQTAEVAKFTTHEKYNSPDALMNDIAVLSLATPLNMTEAVEPVCLPSKEMRMSADSMITVSGWGTTREGGSPSEKLLAVEVPVVTDNQCNEMYSKPAFGLSSFLPFGFGSSGKSSIKETMLCAGYKEGDKDSCQGDSGGPAVSKQESGNFEQVGVVSWGKGCARKSTPGVYTEVPYFIDWINERMQ